MKIKYLLIIMYSCCWANITLLAQENPNHKERLESLRVAYITQELNLTADESQKFWPIYNEYRQKEKNLMESKRPKDGKKLELLSDKEIEDLLEKNLRADEELAKLKREYTEKLKKVVSVRKIAMLRQTEKNFKKELLQRMRDKRKENGHSQRH